MTENNEFQSNFMYFKVSVISSKRLTTFEFGQGIVEKQRVSE